MQLAASSSMLTAIGTGISVVGTLSSMSAQRAAIERENQRLETEAKMAELTALQDENARMEKLSQTLASNLAFASIAGYYDDSRSFLNIQDQTRKNAEKDIAQIRLMGSAVQSKIGQLKYENVMKKQDLTFGGWTSIAGQLTTGYKGYLEEKAIEMAVD